MRFSLGVSSPRTPAEAATLTGALSQRDNMSQCISPQHMRVGKSLQPPWRCAQEPRCSRASPFPGKESPYHALLPPQSLGGEALVAAMVIFAGRQWCRGLGAPCTVGMLLQPGAGLQVLWGQGKGSVTAYGCPKILHIFADLCAVRPCLT